MKEMEVLNGNRVSKEMEEEKRESADLNLNIKAVKGREAPLICKIKFCFCFKRLD